MKISLIVAVAENGVIGRNGRIPWRLPADMRRFKSLTMGHTLVVGKRTFAETGKPLPGRKTIVVSSTADLPAGVHRVATLDDALALALRLEQDELFIAGGSRIYTEALPHVQRMYVTRVSGQVSGDTVVPFLVGGVPDGWVEVGEPEPLDDPGNSQPATLHVYERAVAGEPDV